MAGQELTRDEVFALARAFPGGSVRTTLLSLAGFPSWAVPEMDCTNARESWTEVSGQLEAGVMPGGRVRILEAARDGFLASERPAARRLRFYRDERLVRLHGVVFAEQFCALLNASADASAPGRAAPGRTVARLPVPDVAGDAFEAAQYPAACDPVITNPIMLYGGG